MPTMIKTHSLLEPQENTITAHLIYLVQLQNSLVQTNNHFCLLQKGYSTSTTSSILPTSVKEYLCFQIDGKLPGQRSVPNYAFINRGY